MFWDSNSILLLVDATGCFYIYPNEGTIGKDFLKFLIQDATAVLFAVASVCIDCKFPFIFSTFSGFVLTQKTELVVTE